VGGRMEPVDGGLGEQGVGHLAEPFDRLGHPPKAWRHPL
jgi:hypothetical protein